MRNVAKLSLSFLALPPQSGVVHTIIGWVRRWPATAAQVIESTVELGGTAQIDLVS
jgi:hypothetical protein